MLSWTTVDPPCPKFSPLKLVKRRNFCMVVPPHCLTFPTGTNYCNLHNLAVQTGLKFAVGIVRVFGMPLSTRVSRRLCPTRPALSFPPPTVTSTEKLNEFFHFKLGVVSST